MLKCAYCAQVRDQHWKVVMLPLLHPSWKMLLLFGMVVCSNLSYLVENVQYRVSKVISGAIHQTSTELVYSKLGWTHLKNNTNKG